MLRPLFTPNPFSRGGMGVFGQAPANVSVPTLSTSTPVIGSAITVTPGTWTGAPTPTLTYQWQRNAGGWGDIGGATSSTYTPVDADWGYALRVVETATNSAGNASANSSATGLTREAPTQSLGSQLLVNNSFTDLTGTFPTGWTLALVSGATVTSVAPGGGAGSGSARLLYNPASNNRPAMTQNVLTGGSYYEVDTVLSAAPVGGYTMRLNSATSGKYSVSGGYIGYANGAAFTVGNLTTANIDIVLDSVSLYQVTLNGQLTAPSANMRTTLFYTLPVSPAAGDALWVMPRISDFAGGNYWLALLEYTGSQWNITLYSVAAHTRTQRATASNIGATNGIRINQNGNNHTLETTANDGGSWTQRGSTVSGVSLYNTATGVNVLAKSSVTLGNLVYEAAV